MRFQYPSYEAVVEAHDRITYRSEKGIINTSNLQYALSAVQDIGEDDTNDKRSVILKASYLMRHIITRHPFLDGNKRTAYEVTKAFLQLNGWAFKPVEEEAFSNLILMRMVR